MGRYAKRTHINTRSKRCVLSCSVYIYIFFVDTRAWQDPSGACGYPAKTL